MKIERINSYTDKRFSERVLKQHGAFLVDGEPFGFEIISTDSAVVHMSGNECPNELIDDFRYYAEHITKFYREDGTLIWEYPAVVLFKVSLKDIQPSQFYIDEDKLKAVSSFIEKPEDVIIPLVEYNNRYISADGHTRLALAVSLGFDEIMGFTAESNDIIVAFAEEAKKRNILSPYGLKIVSHSEYEVVWNKFCDEFLEEYQ
ncbi:MAG: hypothetical protein LUH56_03850 [Oscillospiraceae bacterium]|nr:hypothetical protein [Oscillospiraceae bacterium]